MKHNLGIRMSLQELPTPLPQKLCRDHLPHLLIRNILIGQTTHVPDDRSIRMKALYNLWNVLGIYSVKVFVNNCFAEVFAVSETKA